MGRALSQALALALAAATPLVALPPPVAHAQSPSEAVRLRLEEGVRLFGELEYRAAIGALEPLRSDAAATRAQRLSALEIIGISHLILDERPLAIAAFEDLLALDPGHVLQHDDGSPKIREFFEEVRQRVAPAREPSAAAELEHAVPPGAIGGRRVEVEAVVKRGVEQVRAVMLRWRRRGVLRYEDAPMHPVEGGRYRGSFVAPSSASRYAIDYYLEAENAAGGSIGRIGGPDNPLALEVAPGAAEPRDAPWYGRWYVIAGGVVAAGIVTGFVISAAGDDTPDGSLGRVTLSP